MFFAISFFATPAKVFAQDTPKYKINANYASVFSDCDLNSEIVATLKLDDKIELELDSNVAKEYDGGSFKFYKIVAPEQCIGFVLCELVCLETDTISNIPTFNAKTNKECFVFEKTETSFIQKEISLAKNTEIFLYEGFDKDSEFTAICYIHNNEVHYDYLKTDDINPNGINPLIIICLTLILALISLLTALFFMKRRKIKLKKVGT